MVYHIPGEILQSVLSMLLAKPLKLFGQSVSISALLVPILDYLSKDLVSYLCPRPTYIDDDSPVPMAF